MIQQERLAKVADEIVSAAKKLPVGFHEKRIGMELPGTRGWGLSIDISKFYRNPICIWERGNWDGYGGHLWLTPLDINAFISNEAATIALIKATPSLIKWIEDVAGKYTI